MKLGGHGQGCSKTYGNQYLQLRGNIREYVVSRRELPGAGTGQDRSICQDVMILTLCEPHSLPFISIQASSIKYVRSEDFGWSLQQTCHVQGSNKTISKLYI